MPPQKDRDSLQTWKDSMYAARCGDCHWFHHRQHQAQGKGDCLVYPPTVVALSNGEHHFYPAVDQDSRCRLFLVSQAATQSASERRARQAR